MKQENNWDFHARLYRERIESIPKYIYRALQMENKENKENEFSLLSEKVEI